MHYIKGKPCKRCKKCNTDKEVTEFATSKTAKDGYSDWCKDCKDAGFSIAYTLEEALENKVNLKEVTMETTATARTKICTKCDKTKPLTEFHKNNRLKDGHMSQCKKCRSAYMKEHNAKAYKKRKEVKAVKAKASEPAEKEPLKERLNVIKAKAASAVATKKETLGGPNNKFFGVLLTVSLDTQKERIDFIHQLTERVCDSDMPDVEEILKALTNGTSHLSKTAADLLKRTALKLMVKGESPEFHPMYGSAVEYR